MTREEILELAWKQAEPYVFISRDEFLGPFEDFEMVMNNVNGVPAFAGFVKGPEFHYASLGSGSPLHMGAIRAFLEEIIKKEGYAWTKTPADDARQKRFNELIGFKKTGEDEFYVYYRIEQVRPRCH